MKAVNLFNRWLVILISAIAGVAATPAYAQVATTDSVSNQCLSVTSPSTSIGAWWTSGTFNVTNSCSTQQSASGLQITINSSAYSLSASAFQLNSVSGLYFPPPIYWAQSTGKFSSSGNGSVILTLNTTGFIQPMGSATVSYGYNPNGKIPGAFTYSVGSGGTVQPGSINLSINATALKSVCSGNTNCNIPLTLSGQNGNYSSVVATVTNSNAGTTITTSVTNLNAGSYSLSVSNASLPNTVTFSAPAINVVSGQAVAATATFTVTPVTTGNISYTLVQPSGITLANNSLPLNLVNSSGSSVGSQNAVFGTAGQFSNISTGSYTIKSGGLADAIAGIYYAPLNKSVSVSAGNTTALGNLSMTKVSSGIIPVLLNVSGLNNGDTASVTVTDNMNYTYNTFTVSNGTNMLNLISGDNLVFNFSAGSKYSNINPINYMVVSGNAVNVSVTPAPAVKGQIVGYFETWMAQATWESATYSLATVPAYVNIMPLAFAKPDSTYVSGSYNFNAAGLGISAVSNVATGAIKIARTKGQKVLLSVGGATYQNFGALNVPATIALVKDLGLDGIDLDFEPSAGGCSNLNTNSVSCPTDAQLVNIINQLRTGLDGIRPGMMLTAAVWSIGAYGTPAYPTTKYGPVGSNSGIWINPLKQAGSKLDAIFLMSYDAGVYTPTGTACTTYACYDPIAALAAYKAIYSGPVYQGIEVPPEAWGGNILTPAQALTMASNGMTTGSAGTMIWALQVQGSGYTANSFLQPICLLYNQNNSTLCNQTIPAH